MTLMLLLEKINHLSDNNSRKIILDIYELKDFNKMFRQTSIKSENLNIADFLYRHRDELKIDINAKGPSSKSALDFAIEKKTKENVLFLLKLKETIINDRQRDEINDVFGASFRTLNIAPFYVPFGNALAKLNTQVKMSTDDYSVNVSALIKNVTTKKMSILEQVKSINTLDDSEHINQTILINMHDFVKKFMLELNKLNSVYDDFEEAFEQYLPYSYAQEKILAGNEFAKNDLNSSMKNTCLHNRAVMEKTMLAVQHNKSALISNFVQVMSAFVDVLVLFDKTPSNPTSILSDKDKDPEQSNTPVVSQSSQEKQPSLEICDQNTTQENRIASPFSNECYKKINKQPLNTAPKIEPVLVIADSRLERLKDLNKKLTQLKQKGQVKLSVFHTLLNEIGNEIALQIKPTKKGFMVSQSTNQFSFHRPHNKDKGVDKAALASLKAMVDEYISTIDCSRPTFK